MRRVTGIWMLSPHETESSIDYLDTKSTEERHDDVLLQIAIRLNCPNLGMFRRPQLFHVRFAFPCMRDNMIGYTPTHYLSRRHPDQSIVFDGNPPNVGILLVKTIYVFSSRISFGRMGILLISITESLTLVSQLKNRNRARDCDCAERG